MPGLALAAQWDAEEEVLSLVRRPGQSEVAVVRPSLPPVVLGAGAGCLWQDNQGALVSAWSPTGEFLAVGREDGTVAVFRPPNTEATVTVRAPAPWVTALAWGPKGESLAVAAGKSVTWWDPATGASQGAWTEAPSTVADLDWPTLGPMAACGYGGAWIFARSGAPPTRRLEWKGSSLKVRWAPNLKWLATADQDRTVHIWPWPQGSDLMMGSFDAKALSLVWSPSGGHLATSGSASLLLWDCRGRGPGGRKPLVGPEQKGLITGIDHMENYATVDDEGSLTLWNRQATPIASTDIGAPGACVTWLSATEVLAARTDGSVSWYRWE